MYKLVVFAILALAAVSAYERRYRIATISPDLRDKIRQVMVMKKTVGTPIDLELHATVSGPRKSRFKMYDASFNVIIPEISTYHLMCNTSFVLAEWANCAPDIFDYSCIEGSALKNSSEVNDLA